MYELQTTMTEERRSLVQAKAEERRAEKERKQAEELRQQEEQRAAVLRWLQAGPATRAELEEAGALLKPEPVIIVIGNEEFDGLILGPWKPDILTGLLFDGLVNLGDSGRYFLRAADHRVDKTRLCRRIIERCLQVGPADSVTLSQACNENPMALRALTSLVERGLAEYRDERFWASEPEKLRAAEPVVALPEASPSHSTPLIEALPPHPETAHEASVRLDRRYPRLAEAWTRRRSGLCEEPCTACHELLRAAQKLDVVEPALEVAA